MTHRTHIGPASSGRLPRVLPVLVALVLALVAAVPATAAATTISAGWQAKVGRYTVNGTATFYTYTSGSGAILLNLKRLAPSTGYLAGLYRGTCSSLGARIVNLPSVRTSATGTASWTIALSASSASAARTAARSTTRLSIVLGGGSLRKCATFSAISVPPPPILTPCGPPDVCLGQSVIVGSFAVTALSAEIWPATSETAPIAGYVLVTVQVRVVPDPVTNAPGTKLDYPGLAYRVTTPSLLTWYSPRAGIVREPALRPGVTASDAPLVGWLTFEVPAVEASTLRLVPTPGVYLRLY